MINYYYIKFKNEKEWKFWINFLQSENYIWQSEHQLSEWKPVSVIKNDYNGYIYIDQDTKRCAFSQILSNERGQWMSIEKHRYGTLIRERKLERICK
jgi:hypothetical protein